jgi:hypothetical protein
MDWLQEHPELLTTILEIILAVIGWLGAQLLNEVRKTQKGKHANETLDRLERIAAMAVKDIEQTLLPQVKKAAKDGKLSDEDVANLRAEAVGRVMTLLGTSGKKELDGLVGDVGEAVIMAIESKVSEIKRGKL